MKRVIDERIKRFESEMGIIQKKRQQEKNLKFNPANIQEMTNILKNPWNPMKV